MIRHHLTLEHVAAAIANMRGAMVADAYSQEKYQCILTLIHDMTERTLVIGVDPAYGCIAERPTTQRARRNTIDLFPALMERHLATATKHPDDRIVTLWFEDCQLHALLYGGGSGNIIVTQDGIVVDALRRKNDVVGQPLNVTHYTPVSLSDAPPTTTVAKALGTSDIHLGMQYAREICFRCGIDADLRIGDLDEDSMKCLREMADGLIAEARRTTTFFILERHGDVLLSLLPLHGYTVVDTDDDILSAIRRATGMRRSAVRRVSARTVLERDLTKAVGRLRRSIDGMQGDAATQDRASTYRLWADLLLSTPDPTLAGLTAIDLPGWDGESLTIPLDDRKTLVENATALYAKARASDEAARIRAARLPHFEQRLQSIERMLDHVRQTEDPDELERIQRSMKNDQGMPDDVSARYRVFRLDDVYTLYVGKSAANNDELTMRFAKQNDWWFHARGVSGSHAILRGGGSEKPPKQILEQAAAIAAYYSHARNASYTPVVYTQRKYVRKPKGANVGAVTLERETVVMVRPSIPGEEQ